MGNPGYDHSFKFVLVGDSGVGKSNLLSRFTRNEFNSVHVPTVGTECVTRIIQVEGKVVKLEIWDAGAHEHQNKLQKDVFYRGAVCALLVYDTTNKNWLKGVEHWVRELRKHAKQLTMVKLVGNKCDLHHLRDVTNQLAAAYAEWKNMNIIETSALDSTNVEKAFTDNVAVICKFLGAQKWTSTVVVRPTSRSTWKRAKRVHPKIE